MDGVPFEFQQKVTALLQRDQLTRIMYLRQTLWSRVAEMQIRSVCYLHVELNEHSTIDEFEKDFQRLCSARNVYRRMGRVRIEDSHPEVFSYVMRRIAGLESYMNYHDSKFISQLHLNTSAEQVEYALNMFTQWPVYFKSVKLPNLDGDLTLRFLEKQMKYGHIEELEVFGGNWVGEMELFDANWVRCFDILAHICCQKQFTVLIAVMKPPFFKVLFDIWSRLPINGENLLKLTIPEVQVSQIMESFGRKPDIWDSSKALYLHGMGRGTFTFKKHWRSSFSEVLVSR